MESKLILAKQKEYSEEDNRTWSILFARQMKMIQGKVCDEFMDGMKKLKLNPHKVPLINETNEKLQKLGGWKLAKAEQKYLTDMQWGNHFAKREFPVTDYIRKPHELDFTPLPDVAHDYFGHLAFLAVPHYMEVMELFSEVYRLTPSEKMKESAQLWWNTMEFGLIKQNDEIKLLGAGLISSKNEFDQCLDEKRHIPFILEAAKSRPKAEESMHESYLVVESWEHLRNALKQHIMDLKEN